MHAEGKTPLTDAEVAILGWWIDAGAPIDVTLGELELSPDVTPLLAAECGEIKEPRARVPLGPCRAAT